MGATRNLHLLTPLDNPVDLPVCRLVSWTDIDRWADIVAERVRLAGRVPETIVGLTRGGWIPARLLADRLDVKHLAALRAQHWGVTATPNGRAEITESLNSSVRGKAVLVVDDITDTGDSLRLAVTHVKSDRPARLESATFLHISHSTYTPTYYGEEVPKEGWAWFIFPWNYWEDLRTLSNKAHSEAATPEEVASLLLEQAKIQVSAEDVAQALGRPAPVGSRGRTKRTGTRAGGRRASRSTPR